MKTQKILAMVGGNSKDSINKKLFRVMKENAPEGVTLSDFDLSRLPFFSQDLEADLPAPVRELKKAIVDADAILFITPEYNRSIPGILKNAIDWGSRPGRDNSWEKKPAATMGASAGNLGTVSAQFHLKQTLSHLDLRTMNQPEFYLNASKVFDEQGNLTDTRTKEFVGKFWKSFQSWIEGQGAAR